MNEVQIKYQEYLRDLENSTIRPSEILKELYQSGLSNREIYDYFLEFSSLESPDGGAKLIREYDRCAEFGYSDEKIDQMIIFALKRKRQRKERNLEL